MIRQYLILFIIFLFLGGCAQKISTPETIYPNWKTQLSAEKNWQVQGKLAFISPDERQSANLNWQQQDAVNSLVLTSFIGTRILKLEQTSANAQLEYDDEIYTDSNATRLLSRLTGFTIPLTNAEQWLKGTSDNETLQVDEFGRAKSLIWRSQTGQQWQVNYSQYSQYAGYWLPKKMTLKNQDIRIKIQLNNWQFN